MESDFSSRASVNGLESVEEMENRRDFIFENSAFFHRVVGLWPKEDQLLGNFRAIKCHFGIFCTVAIFLMQVHLVARNTDKSKRPELCIEAAMAMSGLIKLLPCVLQRKSIISLYHKTLEINSYLKESSAEKRITYRWLGLQNKLISLGIISYCVIVSTYFIYPLYKGDKFPLPAPVPNTLHQFPWSVIVYTIETIVCFIRLIAIISCDVYLVVFMCQLCCELQLVGHAMLAINIHDKQTIYRAINKHKRTLEYGQMICDDFSSAIVVQHLGMSVGLIFAAISILYVSFYKRIRFLRHKVKKIKALFYCFYQTRSQALLIKFVSVGLITATEILLLCFVGETIAGESLKIADYLENTYEEFLDDAESLKTISFMLLRAQRPLMMRVGDNTIINLNLFRLTMNKVFSCFLILKRAMD